MWRYFLAFVYLISTLTASPCLTWSASEQGSGGKALARFVEKLKADGQPMEFPSSLIRLMEFPPDSTTKNLESGDTSSDGTERVAKLVFSKAESNSEPVPTALFWSTRQEHARKSETYLYRTTLEGTLVRAFRKDGETDENGYDVRGRSTLAPLDVSANDVRARFKRAVLDFWLRGRGRKKASAR